MSTVDLLETKKRILELRRGLLGKQPELGEPPAEYRGNCGVDTDYVNCSETIVRGTQFFNNKLELMFIEMTLAKIEEGSFGICDECEEKIPDGRLKLKPHCPYCVGCLSELEKDFKLRFEVKSLGSRSVLNYSATPSLVRKSERQEVAV